MHPAAFSVLLHRALEVRLGRLLELTAVEGWQQSPTGLHDVRVASRRVRAVLELVEQTVYPKFKHYTGRLRTLTRILGATREMDVHAEILNSMKTQDLQAIQQAALEHAQETLDRARRRFRRRMEKGLSKVSIPAYSALLRIPGMGDSFPPGQVRDPAWACLEPRLRAMLDLLSRPWIREDVAAMHKLRIRVKKCRYALEVLASALEREAGPTLDRLRELQTALGEHHDLATLEDRLRGLHGRLAERDRTHLATGLLHILGLVAAKRRARFDQFCKLAPAFTLDDFAATLRPATSEPGSAS